jgi:HAD superfamily hydrolase (TIGR01509 family)
VSTVTRSSDVAAGAYDGSVNIDAVIFDCDGLLVDTETAWTRAERVLYERRGVEFTIEHKRELIGTSGPVAQALVERHLSMAPGSGDTLQREMRELALFEIKRAAPPMPGAHELVDALRAAGTPIALASNSPHMLLRPSLEGAGFAESFDAVVSAEDVETGKPAPDIYLEACRRLGADPRRSVALEDSPSGVAAAIAAGMFVIGVPSLEGVELRKASLLADSLLAPEVHEAVGLRRLAA